MKLSALTLAALSATSIAFAPAVQAGEYDGYQTCAAYNHRAETPDDLCLVNGHMTSVGAFRAMTNAGPSSPGINDRQPNGFSLNKLTVPPPSLVSFGCSVTRPSARPSPTAPPTPAR